MLWVGVVAAVLRRGFVREDLVVGHVIEVQIVARRTANDRWDDAKIADQSSHRDVHYIVAKTATVWPAAGNNAIAKARLDLADQSVAAKDAQAGEARVIRVGTLLRALPASRHGSVDKSTLIKSGIKIPAMSVRPVSTSGNVPLKIITLIRCASSGVTAYLRNNALSTSGLVRL